MISLFCLKGYLDVPACICTLAFCFCSFLNVSTVEPIGLLLVSRMELWFLAFP